jgi:hydrogenase maturation protein HypF
MADFILCPVCNQEYNDPLNRRFHAQPVACPDCGPEIWLEYSNQESPERISEKDSSLELTIQLLSAGKIGAIKGLGGFHLACDAESPDAISELRRRKNRPDKPLAVMLPDLKTIREYCMVSELEAGLLTSPQRPIVLLQRKKGTTLPQGIAPGQNTIGVMLPYTPLHYLLFSSADQFPSAPYHVLVMTSANFSGNPILTQNQQVREQLADIADFYLFHDRDIHIHCDDSVIRSTGSSPKKSAAMYPIRRSRGYAPQHLSSPFNSSSVLAAGAELKNTFCLTRDGFAFVSQHIGDLKNFETNTAYQESIEHFEGLFRVQPELLVHDLHPDYLSTRYAQERSEREGIPILTCQHHHAHIASCLADNGDNGDEPVIGFSFDGIGYGDDGHIWGGEVLIADYQGYSRAGHLAYFPLPGGDLAVQEPWRTAVSLLHKADIPRENDLLPVAYAQGLDIKTPQISALSVVEHQLSTGTNSPLTSSIGRLFDGVASLIGIRHRISYEGQAAIEMEAILDPDETGSYDLDTSNDNIFHPQSMLQEILNDLRQGLSPAIISARFHNTLAELILQTALNLQNQIGISRVALSGGVWQNMSLLRLSCDKLEKADFQVLVHKQVPANDGGISLGQAVLGQYYLINN